MYQPKGEMKDFLYFSTPQEKLLFDYYDDVSDIEYFCKRQDKYRNCINKLNKRTRKENEN